MAPRSPAIPDPTLESAMEKLRKFTEDDIKGLYAQTTLDPRPYQHRIVGKVLKGYSIGKRSILIESATGSGKTSMGLVSCKALQTLLPDLGIAWVSMRRNLLGQAEKENTAKGINLKNIYFVSMFAKALPPEFMKHKNKLVVVDEAQHDSASSMVHLHAQAQAPYVLGMTATPFRTDRIKLLFDVVIKDAGIGALIKDGYLSQYEHFTIPDWSPKTVAKFYLKDPEKWGLSIMFFHQLEQAHRANALLQRAGIKCDVVTGDSDREAQLDAFRAGDLKVLLNCLVLTEGTDVPHLKTVWCRPSCKGPTIQMCGRAFRKHPSVPVKNVVQCGRSKWPFVRTATPQISYIWEDEQWLSLTPNPRVNELACKMLVALAHTNPTMPKYILAKRTEKRRRKMGNTDLNQDV